MKAAIPLDVFDPGCPSRRAFDAIFSRWGLLTLARLSEQPVRFGVLRRAVGGISERMLAQTLKTLEEEGLVEREEYDVKPPRVEYRLSESGVRMAHSVGGLIDDLYREVDKRLQVTE
jgi:DNA-binding HxlR family transcriptional regulator